MNHNNYYTIIKETHKEFWSFDLQIDWNVTEISGGSNANGYIVQHFRRTACPSQPLLEDVDYYEAWKVVNGRCLKEKRQICDDEFTVGCPFNSSEDIHHSLGTAGSFILQGDVFWIPKNSSLYVIVDNWSEHEVKCANGLKAAFSFPDLTEDYFVFSRPVFKHEWNFVDVDIVDHVVRKIVFTMCPNNTKRDWQLLNDYLNTVFNGSEKKYSELKDSILRDWKKKISTETLTG